MLNGVRRVASAVLPSREHKDDSARCYPVDAPGPRVRNITPCLASTRRHR
jgi:hypothetical protein